MELNDLLEELKPYGARLVAVSKTKPPNDILDLYEKGQRIFGENRARELEEKAGKLPGDIEWHMIGHLQRNKVKYIADKATMIQSVDSIKLMREINKEAGKAGMVMPVLIECKIAEEESKHGFDRDELLGAFDKDLLQRFPNVRIEGVMGMASFVDDERQIRREFASLKKTFDDLKSQIFSEHDAFREISMGMSGDYHIALDEGSTMVRIGSLLFGPREAH